MSSFASKVANTGDIKYERHPVRVQFWYDVTSVLTPRRLLYLTNRHRRRTILVPRLFRINSHQRLALLVNQLSLYPYRDRISLKARDRHLDMVKPLQHL